MDSSGVDVGERGIAEKPTDHFRQSAEPFQRTLDEGVELGFAGDRGAADLVVVKSARGAVLVFRPIRFPGPFPAPGVPLSRHRALHKSPVA